MAADPSKVGDPTVTENSDIWVMWCLEVQQTYSAKARGAGGAGGATWAIQTGQAIVTGGTRGTLQ